MLDTNSKNCNQLILINVSFHSASARIQRLTYYLFICLFLLLVIGLIYMQRPSFLFSSTNLVICPYLKRFINIDVIFESIKGKEYLSIRMILYYRHLPNTRCHYFYHFHPRLIVHICVFIKDDSRSRR